MQPLFIFSLPKAGSTLLQRMLGVSDRISTAAEPWFLLPHLYALKPDGIVSEYWHGHSVIGLEDFYGGFPGGRKDYNDELAAFIKNLYEKRTDGNAAYFLDKTPRYHLICREIIDLFPDGRFIFLWRNPLAVAASILRRWNNGKWKLSLYNVDLYKGLETLVDAYASNMDRAHALKYEDLVADPAGELKKICDYLDIDYSDRMIGSFYDTPISGRMAEYTGSRVYKDRIGADSVDAWKKMFNNPFRKYRADRYLRWIGASRLSSMGYNYHQLNADLRGDPDYSKAQLLSDLFLAFFIQCKIRLSPLRVHGGERIKLHYL